MPHPIYTRRGDAGETRTLAGRTMKKGSAQARALGALDELNAAMGLARARCVEPAIGEGLLAQQRKLYRLGAVVASFPEYHNHDVTSLDVAALERTIDGWTEAMPPLGSFVIPGASVPEATLHVARTVCRRAEREFNDWVSEEAQGTDVADEVAAALADALAYMNRLSDFLFTAARYANHCAGVEDERVGPMSDAGS